MSFRQLIKLQIHFFPALAGAKSVDFFVQENYSSSFKVSFPKKSKQNIKKRARYWEKEIVNKS